MQLLRGVAQHLVVPEIAHKFSTEAYGIESEIVPSGKMRLVSSQPTSRIPTDAKDHLHLLHRAVFRDLFFLRPFSGERHEHRTDRALRIPGCGPHAV